MKNGVIEFRKIILVIGAMFEDQSYHSSYQTLALVQKIIQPNTTLYDNADDFVTAGAKYNISPVYLAAKAYSELGTTTYTISGKSITVNGVTYPAYNVYNIGAADSAAGNAAYNGLVYAVSGTTYGRPWNTLTKAIVGGAGYISSNFISNNQNSRYLEHFNVMNGLSYVGTHVYMQAIAKALSMGRTAIMLVPEIALTKQVIDRFVGRFGKEKLAVMHSKLTKRERYDEWMRIRRGRQA